MTRKECRECPDVCLCCGNAELRCGECLFDSCFEIAPEFNFCPKTGAPIVREKTYYKVPEEKMKELAASHIQYMGLISIGVDNWEGYECQSIESLEQQVDKFLKDIPLVKEGG